jgi:cell division septation protein DedD
MAASQDTEITLGTARLLSLFFGLVIVCAVFFALGYTLGRKSDIGIASAAGSLPLPSASSAAKPAGSAASAPMTFYKNVEQKDANPQLTPAPEATSPAAQAAGTSSDSANQAQSQPANRPDPIGTVPTAGYFVQVAAVTKQEDADALVDALKKKEYPAFSSNSAVDKYFRVQVGPFADIKDAESMRSRLINDGYNPILKK